jgi:DNA-binding MarR family transcriptional regulator
MPQTSLPPSEPVRFWDAQHNRAVRNIAVLRDRVLLDFDVSSAEWFVLDVAYAARKSGISVGQIARTIDVQTTYIALILRRLQNKKLVETKVSREDRRIHLVYLTAAGEKKLKQSGAALQKAFASWHNAIGVSDNQAYGRAVQAIATSSVND